MNIAEINQLTPESLDRLTSDQYRAAFDDDVTGKEFVAKVNALENAPRPRRGAGSTRSSEPAIEQAPAPTGFDPSFDESPEAAAAAARTAAPAQPAAQPVTEQPATEELPQKIYSYQPVDKSGKPVGGLQSFKYRTDAELIDALKKAHMNATVALRTRKAQEIIESAEKVATAYQEPKFLDPKDNPNAEQINQLTANAIKNATLSALNLFQQNNRTYVRSNENAAALINWVGKSGRDPGDAATWELAWTALKPYLEVEQPATTAAPIVEPPKAAAAAAPVPVRPSQAAAIGISSGLSNSDQISEGTPLRESARPAKNGQRFVVDGKAQILTADDLDRMPSEKLKRILNNRANAQAADLAYTQQAEEQSARRARR